MLGDLEEKFAQAIEGRLDPEVLERIDLLERQLEGRSTDDFGFDPRQLKWVLPVGLENVPEGRMLLIANHSGQLPIDATMIAAAMLLEAHPARAVRSMVERWVPSLPFMSVALSRLGQVLGTPENCRHLLKQDEAVLVFPEGARGISKTLDRAYQLETFGHGFMRLALETNTQIVPVAVVGAEEQYPTFWNLKSVARLIGAPSFPLAPTMFIPIVGLLPLPVKYRIYFGQPMVFDGDPEEDEASVGARVAQVKDAVAAMIQRGLDERTGLFS